MKASAPASHKEQARRSDYLGIIKYCIKRYVNLCPEYMRELRKAAYIFNRVDCRRTRAEPRRTYIHCVGAVLYGFYACFGITGGSKKFNFSH